MKILFSCDEYPPAVCGGIGSATKIVAESLVRRGFDVYVVGSHQYGHSLPISSHINGVKVYRLTHFNYLRWLPKFIRPQVDKILDVLHIKSSLAFFYLRKTEQFIVDLIKGEKIDCLELVDYIPLIQFLKKEVSFTKYSVPTVMRVHGSLSFLGYSKKKVNKTVFKNDYNNFKRADVVCAVSRYSLEYVRSFYDISKEKSSVIYNPVETAFLFANSIKPIRQFKTIVFIGKVVETKGAFSLLHAFNLIANFYPDVNLILLGGGEINKGKNIVQQKLRHRVEFKGYVNRELVREYIDNSLFCVIPSFFENFSMVALEVMARSRALIYTSRTSGPEIIDHLVNGILVDPIDVETIARFMTLLLDDNSLCEKLGSAAYDKILNTFSEDKIVASLENYYSDLAFSYSNNVLLD